MQLQLRHLDILSVAKMLALIYAVIGIIFGVLYALFMVIFTSSMAIMAEEREELAGMMGGGIVGALCMVILFPIFYAILGFIGGALVAWLYNVAAGRMGGVVMRFESMDGPAGMTPPAPMAPIEPSAQ